MAAEYLCPMCQKEVYLSDGEENQECPVCSSPLVGGRSQVAMVPKPVARRKREKAVLRADYYLG